MITPFVTVSLKSTKGIVYNGCVIIMIETDIFQVFIRGTKIRIILAKLRLVFLPLKCLSVMNPSPCLLVLPFLHSAKNKESNGKKSYFDYRSPLFAVSEGGRLCLCQKAAVAFPF